MSTKQTLWYSDDFHLYQDGFDEENVYLEVRNGPYVGEFVVRIPLAVWKEMRRHTIEPTERFSDLTDEEMLAEAGRAVDEHINRLEDLKDAKIKGMVAFLTFGGPESTREEMIENFLRSYRPQMVKNPQ